MSGQWTATKTWKYAKPRYEQPWTWDQKQWTWETNHTKQKSAVYELQFLPDGRIVGTGKNEIEVDIKPGIVKRTIGIDFTIEGKYKEYNDKTRMMWCETTQARLAKRNDDDDDDKE